MWELLFIYDFWLLVDKLLCDLIQSLQLNRLGKLFEDKVKNVFGLQTIMFCVDFHDRDEKLKLRNFLFS